MTVAPTIDAGRILEQQQLGGFVIRLLLLSCAVTFFDGFDMNVIAYTATYLTEDFGLSKIQLGNLFAAGTAGMMVGGFLFGALGDRFGRRSMIIASTTGFGILTLCLSQAQSYNALLILRFLNGLAIGGVLPLCWTLNIEYAPARFRATVVTIAMLGYTLGSSVSAPITIWLAPRYGWQAVFLFGGTATLIVTAMLFAWLPESIRFMVNRGIKPDRVAANLRRIAPGLDVPAGARFTLSDEGERQRKSFAVARLFEGPLLWVTLLIWAAYIASSMTVYYKASWTPLVLEFLGYTRTEAASFSSISAIGSALGGLLLMRFTDKYGPISIATMAALGVPVLLYVGLMPTGFWSFLALNFLVNVLLGGAHYGMHSIAGLFYPSAFRANGAGWATSIAKIGSIAGPLIGGFILATHFPVKHIFALLAVSPAIIATALFTLHRLRRGPRDDVPLQAPEATVVAAE
jgi:AAHS family 4-hydroxybenzoate transporter-like MFS transporter